MAAVDYTESISYSPKVLRNIIFAFFVHWYRTLKIKLRKVLEFHIGAIAESVIRENCFREIFDTNPLYGIRGCMGLNLDEANPGTC